MDNSGLFAQTNTLAPLSDIAVKPEAGLDLANPAKLVEKQSPQTRADFLRGLRQVERFVAVLGGAQLRAYQQQVAKAVVDSVLAQRGLSLVVMFPRQSGKNFLQAQLEVYFLVRFARVGAEMIKFSPTFEPQSLNAMRRLEAALQANWLTRDAWKKSSGNHYRLAMRISPFSRRRQAPTWWVRRLARSWSWTRRRISRAINTISKSRRWRLPPMPRGSFGAPPGRSKHCWHASCAWLKKRRLGMAYAACSA